MKSVFTRDERAVVLFLAASLLIGSLLLATGRVVPPAAPDIEGGSPATDPGSAVAPEGPVDVNTASAEELTRLPGVGPVRAEAIVRLRASRGGFSSLDELIEVKGIGPVTLERLRPEATVGGGPMSAGDNACGPHSASVGDTVSSAAPGAGARSED